ncbi:LPS biosynthesis protein [Rufibacter radiotolerans]|uniref:LPS biosynthesis protein n=1 Tax=Rufibacter radiotolerans TaxID=1379910 RepID=A0A0H4VGR1_9BACT|nr:N-acetyl sugar amidotransferase [Rufibacter radiotolerans]AKQ44795.1 LPS biosynthesis protein [Rufibacter radiotolerans]
MKICKRCLYSSKHPLGLTFDDEGICSGCRVHEEKDQLNWEERGEKLRSILEQYKNKSGNNYDCIIPVSGARDSYFIVHTVKNVYGMNPLLVTYNKQYNTEIGIRNLANLRIKFNCDIMTLTVDPEKVKKITRATLGKKGSMYWHCLAGQTVFPVQMAVKFKIPLIIWGAHQGVDQVGMFSHLDEVEMTRKYRKEHDLMGLEAEDLVSDFDNISLDDVRSFVYPDDKELERVGIRGIYLNNYIRWDSKSQHEQMIAQYGYESNYQTRTFDTYNDIDCFNYSDVHDYIKFLKHGYGKVTDHASREIRLKRLTREEGAELVKQYVYKEPQNLGLFLDWIGMKESGFNFIIDLHRSPDIWGRNNKWEWELKTDLLPEKESAEDIDPYRLEKVDSCDFIITDHEAAYKEDHYILIGKGYYK